MSQFVTQIDWIDMTSMLFRGKNQRADKGSAIFGD